MSEDRQLELLPDMDQIPALAIERDAYWNRVANADFLSAQEKRRLLGLPAEETQNEG
jgi:phage portal protein BeeE